MLKHHDPVTRFELLGAASVRTALDAAVDGLLFVDRGGTIRHADDRAAALLGRAPAELAGGSLKVPVGAGERTVIEVDAGPGTRVCELRSTPVVLDGEHLCLVVLLDVTERELARREAEAASRTKGLLIDMVAHELRTPLGVVSGYLSMLREGALGPEPAAWGRPLQRCLEQVEELKRLVADILTAARLESGRLGHEEAPADLRDLARAALRRAAGRGALLRAELRLEVPEAPVPVLADPAQVGTVLDNLINNALTYVDGAPWIEVRVSRSGAGARVSVGDHGIGIPEGARDTVFERFSRGRQPSGKTRPGTGLGLAIARDLARLNRGVLRLDHTAVGEGSTFTLQLPLASRGR